MKKYIYILSVIAALCAISCKQEAPIAVQKITVSPAEYTLEMGDSLQLTAEITMNYGTAPQFYWHSAHDEIATVSETGMVIPVKVSDTPVRIIYSGGMRAGYCLLTVVPKFHKLTSISINPTKVSMGIGETYIITPELLPKNASNKTVFYTTSDRNVAIVDYEEGIVTAMGLGTAVITLTTEDQGLTAELTVTVKNTVPSFSAANSFVVTKAGDYCFFPTRGEVESITNAASAELLWETVNTGTAPAPGSVISNVKFEEGKIWFTSNAVPGNAVIAAKDKKGEIIWSWHVWNMLEEIAEVNIGDAIAMDRNLGALSSEGDQAAGLMYQWGRKDPFLGATRLASDATLMKATIDLNNAEAVESTEETGTLKYVIANPTVWLKSTNSAGDWIFAKQNDGLWRAQKTMYDPCPRGYCVPDGVTIWNGIKSFSLPVAGRLKNTGNAWQGKPGSQATYWYCTPNSKNGACLVLTSSGSAMPGSLQRGLGCSVRCVKMKEKAE